MTKRTRAWIFYSLVLVFFILGGGAVLYAQGWRVQFNPLAFGKIGGIYLHTFPEDAGVFINGRPADASMRLFERARLLNNLFPGTYRITVKKDGYRDWASDLPVLPSFVTSRTKVVLVPVNGETATSTAVKTVNEFGNRLAIAARNGKTYFGDNPVPGDTVLAGTDDGERIITYSSKTGLYFWTDLLTGSSTLLNRVFPRLGLTPATAVVAIPQSGLTFLVHSPNYLRMANLSTGRAVSLEESPSITAVSASQNRIAWTVWRPKEGRSALSVYDLLSGTFLRNADFIPGRTIQTAFLGNDGMLLLADNGALYSLSLSGGDRKKMAEGVFRFALSPDGTAVAVLTKDGVGIVSESNPQSYAFFRIPDAESVQKLIWYKDDSHLFVAYPQKTAFLDFGDLSLKNFSTIIDSGNVEYASDRNALYAVVNGSLLRFDFP